jgi:hypothetical protein
MTMTMPMMMMSRRIHAPQIDGESAGADHEELAHVHHLGRIKAKWWVQCQGILLRLRRSRRTYTRCNASKMMKIEIRTRNIPFANPDSVSTRPYLDATSDQTFNI